MSEVRDYSWGTYAEQKSENECYENLSNAVIQQAVADMADAVYPLLVLTTSQQYQDVPGTEVSGRRTVPVAPSMGSLTGPRTIYH